jgi:hypothetical protein
MHICYQQTITLAVDLTAWKFYGFGTCCRVAEALAAHPSLHIVKLHIETPIRTSQEHNKSLLAPYIPFLKQIVRSASLQYVVFVNSTLEHDNGDLIMGVGEARTLCAYHCTPSM